MYATQKSVREFARLVNLDPIRCIESPPEGGRPVRHRRWWLLAVVFVVAVAVGAFVFSGDKPPAIAQPECPDEPPVVLDPGHGGIDGGANRQGILEKEIVLDVALRTQEHLIKRGVPVVLTRSEDVDLGGPNDAGRLRRDLQQRIRIANHCKAALMVSLHVNAAGNTTERGMLLFFQPSRPSADAARLLDTALRNRGLNERNEAPHPRPDFAVLHWTKAPAVLVELGFVTNDADRAQLTDPAYRERVATTLADGCATIFQNWLK